MNFVSPQLASPLPANFKPTPGCWAVEEKWDGHRLVVAVGATGQGDLFGAIKVRAWSRHGKDRILPPHVRIALEALPEGLYDGELIVPGSRSYGVTVLEDASKLVFVVFDVIKLLGRDLTSTGVGATYDERRALLQTIGLLGDGPVRLAWSENIDSLERIEALRDVVWSREGEGLILKRRASKYTVGKRPKDWLKVKDLKTAVLTVVGFNDGTRGPNSVPVLRDEDGNETTVKAKNDAVLAYVQANWKACIGRKLRIEFQERTPDGSYRHPRWDRWEDE